MIRYQVISFSVYRLGNGHSFTLYLINNNILIINFLFKINYFVSLHQYIFFNNLMIHCIIISVTKKLFNFVFFVSVTNIGTGNLHTFEP